jgi:hypothetical protein
VLEAVHVAALNRLAARHELAEGAHRAGVDDLGAVLEDRLERVDQQRAVGDVLDELADK